MGERTDKEIELRTNIYMKEDMHQSSLAIDSI